MKVTHADKRIIGEKIECLQKANHSRFHLDSVFYDRLLNADGKKHFSPMPDPGKHGIVLRPVSGGDKDETDNDASGNSDNSSSNFHQIDHRRTGLEEDLNQMVLGSPDNQQANPFI